MIDHVEFQTDALTTLLAPGEFRAADRALDALRELAWHRRAAMLRARRHAGPGTRAAVLGRAYLRPKLRRPRASAADRLGAIARMRRGGAA